MERIINQLVEFDKAGQQIVREAQKKRADEMGHIDEVEAEMYRGYQERSELRIEKYRHEAELDKAKQIAAAQKAYEEQAARLRDQFEQNSDEWVREIVGRCIGG